MFGTFSNKLLPITTDYKRFIEILLHYLKYHNNLTFKLLNHLALYNYVTDVNNIKDFTFGLLNILVIYSNEITTSINSKISKVINKTPYIIN